MVWPTFSSANVVEPTCDSLLATVNSHGTSAIVVHTEQSTTLLICHAAGAEERVPESDRHPNACLQKWHVPRVLELGVSLQFLRHGG
jgi:hypothetical protein